MNTSILNLTVVNSPRTKFSDAQVLLREFTGRQFSRSEAESLWTYIVNHKWNMSERLGRDVGFRVASVDFIENFHESRKGEERRDNMTRQEIKIPSFLRNIVRLYFESKGASINF
jgi:hypothetical protein